MCEFTFTHSKSPEDIYERAKSAITGAGGELTGDQGAGAFMIEKMGMSVEGRYQINDTEVKLFVDKKPFFISCQQIEGLIGAQFA